MSAEILASSLINKVSFKVDFNSFRNSLKTIEKVKKQMQSLNSVQSVKNAKQTIKAVNDTAKAQQRAVKATVKEYQALNRVQGKLSGKALVEHYSSVKKLSSQYKAGGMDLSLYSAKLNQLNKSALAANKVSVRRTHLA